jgi:hypothetical protein
MPFWKKAKSASLVPPASLEQLPASLEQLPASCDLNEIHSQINEEYMKINEEYQEYILQPGKTVKIIDFVNDDDRKTIFKYSILKLFLYLYPTELQKIKKIKDVNIVTGSSDINKCLKNVCDIINNYNYRTLLKDDMYNSQMDIEYKRIEGLQGGSIKQNKKSKKTTRKSKKTSRK